jgi:hypothetical protein
MVAYTATITDAVYAADEEAVHGIDGNSTLSNNIMDINGM